MLVRLPKAAGYFSLLPYAPTPVLLPNQRPFKWTLIALYLVARRSWLED